MAKRAKSFRAYKSVWEEKEPGTIFSWKTKGQTLHADKVIATTFATAMKNDSTVRLAEGPCMVEVSQEQWAHLRNFATYVSWVQ